MAILEYIYNEINKFNLMKFYVIIILLLLSNCTEEKKQNPKEAAIESIDGKVVYARRCVSCHGVKGDLGFAGAKDLAKSVLPITMIELQVMHGKGAMNGFEKILSTEEIKAVSKYVYTFRERI